MGLVRAVDISPFLRSDHSCVYLELDLPMGVEHGPGLWKIQHFTSPERSLLC